MKKVFAIFLSMLVLFTNVGIVFSAHYCGGEAVRSAISLGENDLSCGMMISKKSCNSDDYSSSFKKGKCCDDKSLLLETDENANTSQVSAKLDFKIVLIIAIKYLGFYFNKIPNKEKVLNYSPPIGKKNIPILIQSFLI